MPAPPKPERRGPKPKTYLKRSTSPLKRSSRPAKVRRTPAGLAKYAADRKWSAAVKAKGQCVAVGVSFKYYNPDLGEIIVTHTAVQCQGFIDPAHVMSRRYQATRTDLSNGVPLCRNAHDWFTVRPKAWEAFCRKFLGDMLYETLKAKAIAGPKA